MNPIKKIIRTQLIDLKSLRKPSISYCVNNALFPSILTGLSSSVLREMLALPSSEYETQLNQDLFALLINQFRPGFFLEIGANDGFTFSNTVYLEQKFGWGGVLVEANPKYVESLSNRTNSVIVNKAVSVQSGDADFIDAGLHGGLEASLDQTYVHHTKGARRISVECASLQEILDMTSTPPVIDFISVDVEGGEVPIVEQMVTVNRRFRCGCFEYNNRRADYIKMFHLLKNAGYEVFWEGQTMQDLFFVDTTLRSNRSKIQIGDEAT